MARRIGVWLDLHGDPYIRAVLESAAATKVMDKAVHSLDRQIEALGRDAVKTAVEMTPLNHEVDKLGKESRNTTVELETLDRAIIAAKRSVRDLAGEFARTGAKATLIDLRAARSSLSNLQRVRRELEPAIESAGASVGTAFGDFFGKFAGFAMKRPLIAGVIALVPIIGPMISGLIVGAAGLGGLVGGVLSAVKDPKVKTAFGVFVAEIESTFFAGGHTFVQPVIDALHVISKGFADLHLGDAFAKAAPYVTLFAQGIVDLFKNAMPGFNRVMDQSGPIIGAIASGLGKVGTAFGDFLATILSSPGTLDGLKDSFSALAGALNLLGGTLHTLGDLYHAVRDSPLKDEFSGAVQQLDWLNKGIDALIVGIGTDLPKAIAGVPKDMWIKPDTNRLIGGQTKVTIDLAHSIDLAADSTARIAEETDRYRVAAQQLNTTLSDSIDNALDLWKAQNDLEESMRGLRLAIKQNGRQWDQNTAKALENRIAVETALHRAKQAYDAEIKTAGENRAAIDKATTSYDKQVSAVLKLASQAGATRAEVKKLADTYYVRINTVVSGIGSAERQLDQVAQHARNIPQSVPIHVWASVSWIAAKAEGGFVPPGQPTLVGEKGSEIITPMVPSWVTPHNEVAAYRGAVRGGDGASSPTTVNINVSGVTPGMESQVGASVYRALQAYSRSNGPLRLAIA